MTTLPTNLDAVRTLARSCFETPSIPGLAPVSVCIQTGIVGLPLVWVLPDLTIWDSAESCERARLAAEAKADAETNLLPAGRGCIGCGERDMDRLAWIDDDEVRCCTCGRTFDPND